MSIVYSEPGIFNVVEPWVYVDGAYRGLKAGDNSTLTATRNTYVLRGIIELAQAFGGSPPSCPDDAYAATLLFPGHSVVPPPGSGGMDLGSQYFFQVPSGDTALATIDCNWPLRFLGTGNVELIMVLDDTNSSGDMFVITNNNGDNTGGFTFEDLRFKYPNFSEEITAPPPWAAIHLPSGASAQNIRISRCIFEDCPIGFWAQDGLQLSVFESLFEYGNNVGTAIWLGNTTSGDLAKEVFITDCLFSVLTNGPKGSTALEIQSSDQVFVGSCHMDGFTYGIEIIPGPTGANAVHAHFTSCTVYTGENGSGLLGHCCLIQPQPTSEGDPGGGQVAQVVFTGCFFELGENASISPSGGGPGILIDATYGAVDTVRFVSCFSSRWPGPGLQITGAPSGAHLQPANIEVLGGMYAGNNFSDTDASNAYGIWIEVAQGVRISGASCVGKYYHISTDSGASGDTPQQDIGIYLDADASEVVISGSDCRNNAEYGIGIAAGASDIIIDACDLRGNGTNGALVDAAASPVTDIFIRNCNATGYPSYSTAIAISGGSNAAGVQITDCAGYNDQGASLSGLVGSGTVNIENYAWGYFGPVEFYVNNGTGGGTLGMIHSISIDGVMTPLLSGSFYLAPGESGNVTWLPTTGSIRLVVIGK